jgi:hypothetical protein
MQARRVGARYWDIIDSALGAMMWVDFTTVRGKVVDYTVILVLKTDSGLETIRVYDAAHGFNEMHRYTREGGKQPGVEIHRGTLGEGMRAAKADIKSRFLSMIEGWERWR